MANNLPPPKIAIFERVIWSAGRQKSLSVRSGGAGFDRFRHGARNCPFDTSHLGGWCFEWRTIFHHQRSRFSREGFGRQVAKSRSASVLAVPVLTDFATARETARSTPAT